MEKTVHYRYARITKLLFNNDLKTALLVLKEYGESCNEDTWLITAIVLNNQLTDITKYYFLGLVNYSEYMKIKSQIVYSIFELIKGWAYKD